MNYIVVAVRDRAGDVYAQPMYFAAIGQAIRSFSDAINGTDSNSAICTHPDDFDLYHLGSFCDEDGSFTCGVPKQIAVGKDLKLPK